MFSISLSEAVLRECSSLRVIAKPHTNDMQVHMSDIRMTYEHTRVTYR